MPIRTFTATLLLFLNSLCYGQKEGWNWYFGRHAGVNFSSGSPVALTNGALSNYEGVASISDSVGNLLFYTDGMTVYNSSHNIMPNGTGLYGDTSSTQSAIIVKQPGSSTIYFVFTISSYHAVGNGFTYGFRYSIVDMSLNGGLGDVSLKNVSILNSTRERVTAVRHSNGVDFWIVIKDNNGALRSYLLTSSGLSTTPVISNLSILGGNDIGYLKANRIGTKLAMALYYSGGFFGTGYFFLFDFDNSTGIASNKITINSWLNAPFDYAYGVEFSPDGTKLYGTTIEAPQRIIQYDVYAGSQSAIILSGKVIAVNTQQTSCTTWGYYGAIQMGPDGKLYITSMCDSFLNVINYPNLSGNLCGYSPLSVYLGGKEASFGLPNIISSEILPLECYYTDTINASICQGQSYQGYTNSGTYIDTTVNTNGCDTIITLNLTVIPTSASNTYVSFCSNQIPYSWNGQNLTASGTYTFTTINTTGCDSISTLNLTVINNTSSVTTQTACNSYTWPINGTTYSTSGTYISTSTNSNGCMQTDSLILTINNNTSSSTIQTACNSYTWPINGTTFTTSGTYISTSTNANGCTQTDSLILTINNGTSSSTSQTACNSYTWPINGTTYTTSGTYISTSTNANGCTQTDSLILTINNSTSSVTSQTACNSFTWNGTTYITSGIYVSTSTNANGCTQTDSLILTINNSTSSVTTQTACNSFTWNGTTYTTSGTYVATSVNANGCTQTDSLMLTINNSTSSSTQIAACNSYLWPMNGTTYSASGTYVATSVNANGCTQADSLILTINNNSSSSSSVTACNSYFWNGNNYTTSGLYSFGPVSNSNGCDSTATLILTINSSTLFSQNKTICSGEVYDGHTTSGTYVDTLINSFGCDSIYTLNLTVLPNPNIQIQVSNNNPCLGDTVTIVCTGALQYLCQTNSWYQTQGNTIKVEVEAGVNFEVIGTDSNGCQTSITHNFNLVPCCKLFVPNAFSPNNDGLNDYFVVLPDGDVHIELISVYNRWGQEVFKSSSTLGWDGKFGSVDQGIGTYYYLVKYKCYGKDEIEKGDVMLVR